MTFLPSHQGSRRRTASIRLHARFVAAIGLILLMGCGGQPQMGAGNLRLVDSLRTAVSARRSDWLDENARLAAERHAAGELNDEQFASLQAIVAQARDGHWEDAESAVIRLAKAQRPAATAEQIEKASPGTPRSKTP